MLWQAANWARMRLYRVAVKAQKWEYLWKKRVRAPLQADNPISLED